MYGPGALLYVIFITIAWVMTFYTVNFYYLAYQSQNNLKHERKRRQHPEVPNNLLPSVTVQLPLYNEKYVAARLIDSVCQIDYPKDKLEIQVLDDSDDDTVDLIREIVSEYKFKGFNIVHMHRAERPGYKAGALKEGMKHAKGEFIAIFDADFIPPPWFLKKAIGHFADPKLGLVQCKWGHVNENYSTLTEAQAVSLDLHFMVEQKAKSMTHLFMNFNGTAGLWRAACIVDSGGWHTSTLVEDLDLSYRAQLKGWKCLFLEDLVVDAELPVQMNAAKRQQFRWAKGSMQVTMKLLTDVIIQRKVPIDTKIQAFIQLTRHIVNPLFLVQFLIFPILLALDYQLYTASWAPVIGIAIYVLMGPVSYLYVINKIWKDRWGTKAKQYLFLIFFATGISVNNTVAVFDALFGRKNEFLRTPKFGVVKKGDDWKNKEYVLPFTRTTLLEIFFGIYGCIALFVSIFSNNPVFAPIIIIQTIGFVWVAYLSIAHTSFRKKRVQVGAKQAAAIRLSPQSHHTPAIATTQNLPADRINGPSYSNGIQSTAPSDNGRNNKPDARTSYRLMMIGVLSFLIFGAGMAIYGYQTTIYPIDKAMGYLSRAETAQTPEQVADYVVLAKRLLPQSENPVWSFPTARTDFGLIQAELDNVLSRSNSLSSVAAHTTEYNTGLADMHATLNAIQDNLIEAMPYMYVSFTNILLSSVWIAVILFIFAAMRRGRAKYATAVQ